MATHGHYRTTHISATSSSRSSSNRTNRISLVSMTESLESYVASSISTDTPIIITTTVTTTTKTFPAPALPPFAPSMGSDDPLPRPQRGAPPVAPATTREDRKPKHGVLRKLRRAMGLERARLDPALCEEWD